MVKNNMQHVIPLNDLQVHQATMDCMCNPVLNAEYDVATHNAFDGRDMLLSDEEIFELCPYSDEVSEEAFYRGARAIEKRILQGI